jgi:hypothetical protein
VIVAAVVLLSASGGWAQEFEPRTYAVAPVGLNFVAVGYGFATGAVLMDPAIPVDDVDGDIHVAFARYVRTLSLFNRPSKLKLLLPWTSGSWTGTVEGLTTDRHATGIGDVRIGIETLFAGTKVEKPADMPAETAPTVWGARLQLVAPTGAYENDRVVNLGSNRWTFIPEVGFSHAVGRWSLEGAVATWLFTDNDDFVDGRLLEQDPLLVAKLHAIRSVRPGFWWAVAAGYGYGGRTYVDGEQRATIQRNWRVSAMLAYPLTTTQGFSVSLATGGNAGAGTDADAITVAYQVAWGGR